MRITKAQMRRIINEETLAVKLERQMLSEHRFLVEEFNKNLLTEHQLLVEKRQDFDSLIIEQYLKISLGEDFDIHKLDEGVWSTGNGKVESQS